MARSFWLRRTAWAAGMLLALAMALATPASAQDATRSANSSAVGDSLGTVEFRRRAATTDMLRAAFVLDMAGAWQGLAPDERAQLRLAIGPEHATTAAALGWFMYGTAVHLAGEELAGLYNPIADVWLLLHWRRSAGAPRIAAAFLVPGAALRPDAEAGRWSESDGPYAAALATADSRAAARFRELGEAGPAYALVDWLAPRRMALRQQAFAQITPWLGGLQNWRRSSNWRRLQNRLVAADRFAASLASVPPDVRRSLIPLGALRRADGVALLLGSPLAPGRLVAVDNPEARAPAIQLVDLTGGALPAAGAGGRR